MNVLDLFSGIGGFSLGLERAGMRTVAFCEIEPYCRAVLAYRWPGVTCYGSIEELRGPIAADVICGGFPCQDISVAGAGAGLAGARSGLWSEYARIIGEVRPKFAIVENVSALLGRGLGDVLGDLASLGYDAEWHCIPASAIGAPHRRDRIWIIAHARECGFGGIFQSKRERGSGTAADVRSDGKARPMADTNGGRSQGPGHEPQTAGSWTRRQFEREAAADGRQWRIEPDVGRVADGVPSRVDRLKALGNSIVPQIAEIIGRAIMSYEHAKGEEHGI